VDGARVGDDAGAVGAGVEDGDGADEVRVGDGAAEEAGAVGDAVDGGGVVDDGVGEAGLVGDGDGDDGSVGDGGAEAGLVGGVDGTSVGADADGDGDGAGGELVGDGPEAGWAAGTDAEGWAVACTGGAGEADDEGAARLLAACGGRLFTSPAPPVPACLPLVWPETPSVVPVTGRSPVLLRSALPESCDDGAEFRGTKSTVLCANPGHTNASNSSAASSPAPAAAAGLRATAVPAVPAPPARRRASGASRDCASSGTARKSSVTCSFSSVPASTGSSSGAHRPVQSSRRL
jgi:hypothetical protein